VLIDNRSRLSRRPRPGNVDPAHLDMADDGPLTDAGMTGGAPSLPASLPASLPVSVPASITPALAPSLSPSLAPSLPGHLATPAGTLADPFTLTGAQPAVSFARRTDAVVRSSDSATRSLTWGALPDAVLVADAEGALVAVNDAAERVLGLDAASVIGHQLADVLPLMDGNGASWWESTRPFASLATVTRQPERLLLTTDGRPMLVTASFHRAGGPLTSLTNLVVCVRPATDRMRAERRSAELVSTAAHELRSPLTSIKGFTATLLAKWDRFTDEQRRLIVETVDHDADRLTRLIVDLLDVARIDSDDVTLRCEWVDLAASVTHSVKTLVAGGAAAERFHVEVDPDLPLVWADPDRLARVFLNLLDNALRHGAGLITTTLATSPAGQVSVSVSDEGEGIPEHLAARAFHKFWHASRDGTGLGLYVVRGLVEAHRGTINVDRSPQGGARFQFALPIGPQEA
jgi:PAS domain S-box-containing protein